MAAYKDLVGQKITKVTSNPGEPKTGQMWYNSTDGKLRGLGIVEAWASTSPLIQSRDSAGAAGIQTAAMVFGGRNEVDGGPTGGPTQQYNLTEEYNGTGYSTGGALVQGRQGLSGAGTQTAGLGVGGYHPPSPGPKSLVEEYDGSSWSEVTNQPTATFGQGSAGTQTAAVVFGGRGGPGSTWTNATYEYDGSSWTTGGSMGTARVLKGAATGTQTAALAVGGDLTPPGGATNKVEEYDGTSFSEVNAAPANIQVNMVSGIQTSALSFGGNISPYTTQTFKYDGTNFTASAAMGSSASGQNTLKAAPDNSTGLSMGGYGTSSYIATSQEFNTSTNTTTAAAWSSGGTYPYAAANVVSLGPATAMLSCGGNNSGPTKQTTVTLYNGTSYSAETGMPAAANGMGQGKGGTETAGLVFGGNNPGSNTATDTILYNGSSWTSGGALSTGRRNLGGIGISTAALAFGGQTPSYTTATDEYGGSSWTAGGALPAARRNPTGVGSQTAGLVLAGQSPPAVGVNTSFTYNGTSYSGGPTMINNRSDAAASGPNSSNTSALVYGGSSGSPNYTVLLPTESYDGSAFSTSPSLSTGRDGDGSGSSASEGVQVAGYIPSGSYSSATEQFTPESTAANIADFTTS